MKTFNQIAVFLILCSLQGWAISSEAKIEKSTIDWTEANSIKEYMVYKLSPIKGEQTFAPNVVLSDPSLSENFSEIYLVRSESFKEGELFTLFITASYMDTKWRDYNKAVTSKDIELEVATLNKKQTDCSDKNICAGKKRYEEQLAINIDFIEIVDSMATNLDLTLSNQNPGVSNSGKNEAIESNSIKNSQGKNKRAEMITIPGSYFLAIMRTLKLE